jgi:hypothetical protein
MQTSGVDVRTAATVISEAGWDMSKAANLGFQIIDASAA